jgi:hypothetical protein
MVLFKIKHESLVNLENYYIDHIPQKKIRNSYLLNNSDIYELGIIMELGIKNMG